MDTGVQRSANFKGYARTTLGDSLIIGLFASARGYISGQQGDNLGGTANSTVVERPGSSRRRVGLEFPHRASGALGTPHALTKVFAGAEDDMLASFTDVPSLCSRFVGQTSPSGEFEFIAGFYEIV